MRFLWEGKLYQFAALPFGLASAPRLFTKLMKPVVAILRSIGVRLLIYLDDIILFNQCPNQLLVDMNSLVFLLRNLGLVVNDNKSIMTPVTQIEYLGMTIDSVKMELALPSAKVQAIIAQCRELRAQKTVTIQALARIIGTLTSTVQAILPAPLYYRHMQLLRTKALARISSYATKIDLDQGSRTELTWWIDHLKQWNGRSLISPGPDMVIQTDASKKGWGAYREGPVNAQRFNGLWSMQESKLQINLLELRAAEFAVKALSRERLNLHIHLKMDNVSALTHINKMGGARSRELIDATKSLWEYCLTRNITLTAEFLPGVRNTEADKLSREFNDSSNRKLSPGVFKQLVRKWGQIDLDLFADRLNAQTRRYYSWKPDPLAAGMDAFLME